MFYNFMVYIDGGTDQDGNDILMKIAVPAKDEQDARDYVAGNGDIIAVQDVSDQYRINDKKYMEVCKNENFRNSARNIRNNSTAARRSSFPGNDRK